MRHGFARYVFLLLIVLHGLTLFAQSPEIEAKLDAIKAKNDLTNWIYDRLDYVNESPEKRLDFLMATQKESWRKSKSADEHFAWLNLLSTQGYYQLLAGNILESIQQYENAFSFYNKYKVNSYNIVEYTLKPLSNNYTRLGDYERALYLQKLSIKYQSDLTKDPNEIAAIFCNMAISYRSMEKLDEAKNAIDKGLALKPNVATQFMLNNVYADILYDMKKYNEAALIIHRNLKKTSPVNAESAYWLMSAHTTAGNIYLEKSQWLTAKINYEKALLLLKDYSPHGRIREKANLFTQLGKVALAQKKSTVAIQYFNKTLATLGIADSQYKIMVKNIYGDNKLVDVFLQLANAQLQLKQHKQALANINLSLLSANKIRNEFDDDKTKERLQRYLKKIAEQGIDISYNLFQSTKDKAYLHQILLFVEHSKSRTLLDQIERNSKVISESQKNDSLFIKKQALELSIVYQEKQNIEQGNSKGDQSIARLKFDLALVKKAITKKYNQLQFKTVDEKINLSLLPKNRILSYFFGEENAYVIDINNQKIERVVKLENAAQIKEATQSFVQTYFKNGANAMLNSPKSFYNASHSVYQLVFAPLRATSKGTITVIPDGILGYLSFDGLITHPNYTEQIAHWPFFIKDYQTSYAFSLKTLQVATPKNEKAKFTGLFITHEKGNKSPLKAIKAEAAAIEKNIDGRFLFDEDVNAQRFEQAFGRSSILHIGTHAYLSGADQEPTLDFGEEKIYLFELSAKQNSPSLVVLSACRTGDGFLADGEGIISLSRGFNAIGTSATIASLWNVNDNTAATIIGSFYRLLGEGKSSTSALRMAKLAWLNDKQNSNASLLPYYWDSLVYMGADQQFDLHKPLPIRSIMLWSTVILSICGLILITLKIKKRNKRYTD